jgi:hypothetical protein
MKELDALAQVFGARPGGGWRARGGTARARRGPNRHPVAGFRARVARRRKRAPNLHAGSRDAPGRLHPRLKPSASRPEVACRPRAGRAGPETRAKPPRRATPCRLSPWRYLARSRSRRRPAWRFGARLDLVAPGRHLHMEEVGALPGRRPSMTRFGALAATRAGPRSASGHARPPGGRKGAPTWRYSAHPSPRRLGASCVRARPDRVRSRHVRAEYLHVGADFLHAS